MHAQFALSTAMLDISWSDPLLLNASTSSNHSCLQGIASKKHHFCGITPQLCPSKLCADECSPTYILSRSFNLFDIDPLIRPPIDFTADDLTVDDSFCNPHAIQLKMSRSAGKPPNILQNLSILDLLGLPVSCHSTMSINFPAINKSDFPTICWIISFP